MSTPLDALDCWIAQAQSARIIPEDHLDNLLWAREQVAEASGERDSE